jgi:CBS domain containing-hemolysin-like protein
VGGLVFGLLGKVAETGDAVEHDGVRFVVEHVDGRRIGTVRVDILRQLDENESARLSAT